ncbi:hypothetical protein [Riemerella anatipestifer]|uniref:hypothetical protein n=1 Tax=Riemerella anatipestifer TaxID=34085 RepID=UPI00030CBD5C|nr:hypothetical protein [Riemerella anatipestifer]MBT0540542.1 hypothetical protein [Riemerella anatipestifer]MBT0559057.1 hypothetical protein [Riemerella anatipestifer]MBT0563158.1 hypothetical protein [Riemerella anatipestifer]MBT0565067.1 hypothetical protein [Riemerella anatipestifer]MCE4249213.1 hypothetical protein [Riemerella anatipestifer]
MFKIIEVRDWILEVGRFGLKVDEAVLSSKLSYLTSNLKKRLPPLNTHKTRRKAKTERA